MDASGFPMVLPKFDNTLGPLLLGGMFAMALWGITCVQTFTYFSRGKRDRGIVRAVVAGLLVLDTFDTSLNIHLVYHYMVSNYMNFAALLVPVWSLILHVAITASSNFIIRTLFAYRIYRLSNNNILLTAWIMCISLTDLATGMVITVKAFRLTSFMELDTLSSLMYLTFAAGTGADLSVAVSLCWLLRGSRTGFKKTDSTIKVLMLYTINTGFIVAIDAALGMILYIVMPNNFIFLGFYLLLSKLYLNSYLATMNARKELRKKMNEQVSINFSDLSGINSRRANFEFDSEGNSIPNPSTEKLPSQNNQLAISIQTKVDRETDRQTECQTASINEATSRTGQTL